MQTLCPIKTDNCGSNRVGKFPLCLMLFVCLLAHTFESFAQNSAYTPMESLEFQARQWASQTPYFKGHNVTIAPLDPRLPVRACQQMLQFDQPFPEQPSVRVRCAMPSWQLYITLTQGTEGQGATSVKPGMTSETHKVVVANELLKRGTLLSPSMFRLTNKVTPGMDGQLIQDPKQVSNMELVRDLLPDTPLKTYDVKNAVLIKRGQNVLITVGEGQGFLITVKAESQQDGSIGETIRLKNTESGRLMSAEVTGSGTAKMK